MGTFTALLADRYYTAVEAPQGIGPGKLSHFNGHYVPKGARGWLTMPAQSAPGSYVVALTMTMLGTFCHFKVKSYILLISGRLGRDTLCG